MAISENAQIGAIKHPETSPFADVSHVKHTAGLSGNDGSKLTDAQVSQDHPGSHLPHWDTGRTGGPDPDQIESQEKKLYAKGRLQSSIE